MERDRCAFAQLACDLEAAAVKFDDLLRQGQTKPSSTMHARKGVFDLFERTQDALNVRPRNSNAMI